MVRCQSYICPAEEFHSMTPRGHDGDGGHCGTKWCDWTIPCGAVHHRSDLLVSMIFHLELNNTINESLNICQRLWVEVSRFQNATFFRVSGCIADHLRRRSIDPGNLNPFIGGYAQEDSIIWLPFLGDSRSDLFPCLGGIACRRVPTEWPCLLFEIGTAWDGLGRRMTEGLSISLLPHQVVPFAVREKCDTFVSICLQGAVQCKAIFWQDTSLTAVLRCRSNFHAFIISFISVYFI